MPEHRDLILREFARQADAFEDDRINASFTRYLGRLIDFVAPTATDVCLDVACGTGLVARALAGEVRHVTALDMTPEMLATGKASADAEGATNVVFQEGDATRLPFLAGSFSLVVTRFSLHQVSDPSAVVAELLRVCRPGGRVVIADLVRKPDLPGDPDRVERLRDPSHGTMQTVEEIRGLLPAVQAADVFDVPRPLSIWLEQSRTPAEVAGQIEEELRRELSGGPATGMRPMVVEDALWFTQTWAHLRSAGC
ncbi:class I SAM-dependent methyltransferase [Paractinoplanes rishiriensis]|uniref:Methyltransferase YcgJ n=1 Tax=Paractinoplanes rishiriensis TaxID=1050105 RepID=A0A919KB68_9ACTN|nr:methyltransferase domain-containing protein [Actinoplanes rishiriensis]GIF00077.1 putative methyltransferase YcgJ [Actinoplanes rishiriensis]